MIDLDNNKFLNVKDLAKLYRCSRSKIYDLRDNGTLPMHKNIAGVWVAKLEDVEKLLEYESYQ